MKSIKEMHSGSSQMRGKYRAKENLLWLCVLFFLSTRMIVEQLKIIKVVYIEFVVAKKSLVT